MLPSGDTAVETPAPAPDGALDGATASTEAPGVGQPESAPLDSPVEEASQTATADTSQEPDEKLTRSQKRSLVEQEREKAARATAEKEELARIVEQTVREREELQRREAERTAEESKFAERWYSAVGKDDEFQALQAAFARGELDSDDWESDDSKQAKQARLATFREWTKNRQIYPQMERVVQAQYLQRAADDFRAVADGVEGFGPDQVLKSPNLQETLKLFRSAVEKTVTAKYTDQIAELNDEIESLRTQGETSKAKLVAAGVAPDAGGRPSPGTMTYAELMAMPRGERMKWISSNSRAYDAMLAGQG